MDCIKRLGRRLMSRTFERQVNNLGHPANHDMPLSNQMDREAHALRAALHCLPLFLP